MKVTLEIDQKVIDSIKYVVSEDGRAALENLCFAFQEGRKEGPEGMQGIVRCISEDQHASSNIIAAAHLGCFFALLVYDQHQAQQKESACSADTPKAEPPAEPQGQ